MPTLLQDRRNAGRQLAKLLAPLAGRPHLVVLGLPRGGVPVAAEVAAALGAPLDVFIVRRLTAPGYPELALGAVASAGTQVIHEPVVRALRVNRRDFDAALDRAQEEIRHRERAYREDRPCIDLKGATVILVDDGVATGSTMLAGILALRQMGVDEVIAAAPLMAGSAHQRLTQTADRCQCLTIPEPFFGLSLYYLDFEPTSDEEVCRILRSAQSSAVPATTALPA